MMYCMLVAWLILCMVAWCHCTIAKSVLTYVLCGCNVAPKNARGSIRIHPQVLFKLSQLFETTNQLSEHLRRLK